MFTVLLFGLSSAGHIFTKVVRTLVNHWRAQSFPIIVYLDDGWVCDTNEKFMCMTRYYSLLYYNRVFNLVMKIQFYSYTDNRLIRIYMEFEIRCDTGTKE